MHFHLAHIIPDKSQHGLQGYKEIIDTVEWGLVQLGHTVSYGLNELSSRGRNILFGVQMMDPSLLEKLPEDTIAYNFEQGRGLPAEKLRPAMKIAARRFEIWDYTAANMPMWEQLGALRAEVVPVGYAPILERVPRVETQDIDVLIYGGPGRDRLDAFKALCDEALTCVFVCGLYGKARDELIARSKMVLNIHLYQRTKIFEIVRASYLMANRKAVVAEIDADTVIEDDVAGGICMAQGPGVIDACKKLAADRAAREKLEQAAFDVMSRRDIRQILAEVID